MATVVADWKAILSHGMWMETTVPAEPTLSVVNDGNGSSVTATVDGDSAVTNSLYYRAAGDSSWTAGLTRSADGDIVQTGLTADTLYDFIVVSSLGGYNSLPSAVVGVYVTSGTEHIYNIEAILNLEQRGAELEIMCTEEP